MSKLSIVIPAYNERPTVAALLERVASAPLPEGVEREIVIVDDGSNDGTGAEIEKCQATLSVPVIFIQHPENRGKGAALRTGFGHATGDFVVIQDADLEYSPSDYPVLLGPLLEGRADVVFGSRFLGGPHRVFFFWHYLGNKFLTTLSNMLTDLNLSDMETCYKIFRRELLESLDLRSDRFAIEPEITAKVAKAKARIYEVPISYHGRTYQEGKKIGWRDGISAVFAILRYNLF